MNSTVPAPTYPTASAARTAAAQICSRTSAWRPGYGVCVCLCVRVHACVYCAWQHALHTAGASSMIFWCLLCTLQSLSNKCTVFPCLSPNTWTSTCLKARDKVTTRTNRSEMGHVKTYKYMYTIPWSVYKLFHHNLVVSKALLCLTSTCIQSLLKLITTHNYTHSFSTTAKVSLDHHRIAMYNEHEKPLVPSSSLLPIQTILHTFSLAS